MDFDYIHLRVTKDQKERYKRLCEAKGLSQIEYFTKLLDALELIGTTTTTTSKHIANRPKYPENWEELYVQWEKKSITSKEFMEKANLRKATFYNLLSDYTKYKKKSN